MSDMNGKTTLVTDASRGIGRATADFIAASVVRRGLYITNALAFLFAGL